MAAMFGLLMVPAGADAQTVNFAGTTSGCFGSDAGCAMGSASSQVNYLTFTGSSFSADDYYLDNLPTGVGSTTNNFGLFNLTWGGNGPDFYNDTFQLWIAFTSPTNNTETFNALLAGTVASSAGGVSITFNSPTAFTWHSGAFTYTVAVNDVFVNAAGEDTQLQGSVMATATTVPEPISMVLMGSGLLGVAGVRRRRRKNGDVQNA